MEEKIAIIGLGYVGLPIALALARRFPGTVGFDTNERKVRSLRAAEDPTGVASPEELKATALKITSVPADLGGCTFFIVAVPTPIDEDKRPDLSPVRSASELVGPQLRKGGVVVYESTVYPGVTEDFCAPILEQTSKLKCGTDFTLGYSPERINPGDTEHTLERITKVVSGQDAATLDRVAHVYGKIITAGVHRAPSIKVAEAAKVIENTQRDLNIALMNELVLIFDRLGISTRDVLAAARTKWNFLPFTPGLVGGHCIGVDPYYLTTKAEQLGYHPQVILAGRRVNDNMGIYVAQRTLKMMVQAGISVKGARVAVLGLTFKEDVPDCRNSRVPDIVRELKEFGVTVLVHDPLVTPEEAQHEYGLTLCKWEELTGLDGVVAAVKHKVFAEAVPPQLPKMLRQPGVFMDVKWMMDSAQMPPGVLYGSL